jgi:hypothetical protein
VNKIKGGGYLGTKGNRDAMEDAANKIARHSDGGF